MESHPPPPELIGHARDRFAEGIGYALGAVTAGESGVGGVEIPEVTLGFEALVFGEVVEELVEGAMEGSLGITAAVAAGAGAGDEPLEGATLASALSRRPASCLSIGARRLPASGSAVACRTTRSKFSSKQAPTNSP